MQKESRLFRLTATVALAALLSDTLLPLAAIAQPAPPPLPAPGQGRPELNQYQGDPPARVGRVASVTGSVSFHNLGDTAWSAATPNYPVASGNAFWTEPSSEARLEVSDSRIVMAGGTEFDVSTLDASGLRGIAPQGEIYIHLQDLAPNEVWSIETPRGAVRLSGQGRYAIAAGTTDQPTLVTVVEGVAQIDGPGVSVRASANQTASIGGTDSFQGVVGPEQRDGFLTERLNAERPPPVAAAAVPTRVVYAMAGGGDLIGTGNWSEAPEYGQVWYPPVPATWVPYREGHWAYVAPWGWTWVDDAPWGFAPFHYGRWVQIGGRWAWTPGAVVVAGPPVYAPALVTFIGIGAGIALGAAIATGSIGWVPLGPREAYHPWYHASNNYLRQVNVSHMTNVTNNSVTINNYVNRGAATSIPAAAMVASRPVQGVARPITAQEFAAAHPIAGRQPIRPTAATAGVTPVVARQLSLAPAGVPTAPGPAVRPAAAGTSDFARPTFAPGLRTQSPGVPAAVVPGAVEPGHPTTGAVPGAAAPTRPAVEPGRVAPGAVVPGRPVPGVVKSSRPAEGAVVPARSAPGGVVPGSPLDHSPTVVHPSAPNAGRPEVARPAAMPVPQTARPPLGPQAAIRPAEPTAPRPEAAYAMPHAVPLPAPRPMPLPTIVQPAARPAPTPVFVAPHPEARAVAPPPPRMEARPAELARPAPPERKKLPGEK